MMSKAFKEGVFTIWDNLKKKVYQKIREGAIARFFTRTDVCVRVWTNKRTAFEKASKTCVRNRTRVRNVTTRKNHTDPTQDVCFSSSFFLLRVEALTLIHLFLSIYLAFFFIPSLLQLLLIFFFLFISHSPCLVFLHIIFFSLASSLSLSRRQLATQLKLGCYNNVLVVCCSLRLTRWILEANLAKALCGWSKRKESQIYSILLFLESVIDTKWRISTCTR